MALHISRKPKVRTESQTGLPREDGAPPYKSQTITLNPQRVIGNLRSSAPLAPCMDAHEKQRAPWTLQQACA